jgi:hypothetical protein
MDQIDNTKIEISSEALQLTEQMAIELEADDAFYFAPEMPISVETEMKELKEALSHKEGQLKTLQHKHKQIRIEGAINETLRQQGANVSLLMPHLRPNVDIRQIDDEDQICVIGDDGDVAMKESGDLQSLSELVESFKTNTDFAAAFTRPRTGGGMSPTGTALKREPLTVQDQQMINNKIEEIAAGTVTVTL